MLILAAAMAWYTQLPIDGHFWPDLLPPYLIFALGLAFGFVPVTIAALSQVAPSDAGLASGLINTSQQIGGAIGVAIASTVFTSYVNSNRSRRCEAAVTPRRCSPPATSTPSGR